MRIGWALFLAALSLGAGAGAAAAQTNPEPPALCSPAEQLRGLAGCPDLGPGAAQRRAAAAGLAWPLPALVFTATLADRGLTPHAYGRVATDTAPVYRHPAEALAGLPPLRRFEKGFVFASVLGQAELDGAAFTQINPGEYLRAEDIQPAQPSRFGGQAFAAPPPAPVGWLITTVQVSAAPGAAPAPDAPYAVRYFAFQVLNTQRVGDWNWYEIAPGQWLEQRQVALVQPAAPAGAPADVIAVDTYEQTLGVYRGGHLVFATLISSGSRAFPTRPGLFQIWARFTTNRMTGAYFADRRDYYFLEDVPWVLYYDGDRALHGAYWHDNFGLKTSHGCVNLAPRDARWLFEFARVGDAVLVFSSGP